MAYGDPDGAGVGGWLAFLVLVLAVFRPLAVLIALYANLYADPNVAAAYGPVWPAIQLFEWLINGAMIAGCWYLAWRLSRRQVWRTVPITIIGIWLVSPAYLLIDLVGISMISGASLTALSGYVARPLVQSVVFSILWTAYLLRSKRVANTYPRHETEIAEVFG
jgi:hypothetical protein